MSAQVKAVVATRQKDDRVLFTVFTVGRELHLGIPLRSISDERFCAKLRSMQNPCPDFVRWIMHQFATVMTYSNISTTKAQSQQMPGEA